MDQDKSVIPADTKIGQALRSAVAARRIVFVSGLPSSGKSLLLQQLAILAHQAGRRVHSLQWDTARSAFETEHWLKRYPEENNLTHPGIRKAVGLWVRGAIHRWHVENTDPANILIAEMPAVGGRFSELFHLLDDAAETILADEQTMFFVPVPTLEMRSIITGFRAETFSNPRNAEETKDAPIYIVEHEWVMARQLYNSWNGLPNDTATDQQYEPVIYASVFERLLRFRNHEILDVDQVFETTGSAYERAVPVKELRASKEDVATAFAQLEEIFPENTVERAVDDWANF